jgi:hypothetical protein
MYLEVEDVEGRVFIDKYNVPEDEYDKFMGHAEHDRVGYYQNHIRHVQQTYHEGKLPPGWK